MTKGAPILRTAVRTKLRLELSYRDVFLPRSPIADEDSSSRESQDKVALQNSEWDFAAVL